MCLSNQYPWFRAIYLDHFIFLKTGFLSWHPRISAMRIKCKMFWFEKQNSRNLCAPQAGCVNLHWCSLYHLAEDRDLSVPQAQAWFFFIMCGHPFVRGIKFFYPNDSWPMKVASVMYDCEHHLKDLRTLPQWSGLKFHEAVWVTFPSSNHDEGQVYKTHLAF